MQWLEAASDCCCIRTMFLPIMGLVYGQQRVNNRIRHVVKQLQPNLSQRTKDLKIRKMELDLDHLELEGQCCVCRRHGAKVPGRQRHDGGLTKIDEEDMAELANIFGIPCRGYLCATCIDVAVRIGVRKALGKQHQESFDVAAPTKKQSLPDWAIAALRDRKCDACKAAVVTHVYPGVDAAELLCRVCVCKRKKRALRHPLSKPLPEKVYVLVLMLLSADRPQRQEIGISPQPQSLFVPQKVNLFQLQSVVTAPADPDRAASDFAAPAQHNALPFSVADFSGLIAEAGDPRSRLQKTRWTLFAGQRVRSQKTFLFDDYWGPDAPGTAIARSS